MKKQTGIWINAAVWQARATVRVASNVKEASELIEAGF